MSVIKKLLIKFKESVTSDEIEYSVEETDEFNYHDIRSGLWFRSKDEADIWNKGSIKNFYLLVWENTGNVFRSKKYSRPVIVDHENKKEPTLMKMALNNKVNPDELEWLELSIYDLWKKFPNMKKF